MNEGIHLDLDTWIVPGQIRKANLCRGLGNRYTPAGTEVLISAVAHNTPPPFQAVYRVRRQHLNLDKALDKLGEIPDLNLGDLGKFRWWRFVV